MTKPLLDVLEVLVRAFTDGREMHGWDIMRSTKLSGPTVYGVLDRLEDQGWIVGSWEEEPSTAGKPRRRYYALTGAAAVAARSLLTARRPATLSVPWRPARPPLPGDAS